MAKKSKDDNEKSGLVAAAEAVGSAAGKVAAMIGATPNTPSQKKAKLQPKHKHRLPRRQKKAQQRAHKGSSPSGAVM